MLRIVKLIDSAAFIPIPMVCIFAARVTIGGETRRVPRSLLKPRVEPRRSPAGSNASETSCSSCRSLASSDYVDGHAWTGDDRRSLRWAGMPLALFCITDGPRRPKTNLT